jgi:hypothetical protein
MSRKPLFTKKCLQFNYEKLRLGLITDSWYAKRDRDRSAWFHFYGYIKYPKAIVVLVGLKQ